MALRIVAALPPNIQTICQHLTPSPSAVFCFGDILYNPTGAEVPEDVMVHEEVHSQQQAAWTSPEVWWTKYLLDPQFREQQELEAYAAQYAFIRAHYPTKAHKEALFELASNLSAIYSLSLSHPEAEAKIRRFADVHA